MKYKVTSARMKGYENGDVINADDLQGVNIEALVAAGHLKKQSTAKSEKAQTKEEVTENG